MTANNAPSSPTELSAEQKAHEPSMDDILASIRRLISDDDALPLSRRARASARSRAATPSVEEVVQPEAGVQAAEQTSPPKDAFFGLVHRLGRHSSAAAPESIGLKPEPPASEAKQAPSVSPPPASVIAKTPALKLRDFALKNFVNRPDADTPVERERATVEIAKPPAPPPPFATEGLRPSLPTADEPAQAPAAPLAAAEPHAALHLSSVISLPTRPAPVVEARLKIAPLPPRPPVFAPRVAEAIAEPTQDSPEEPRLLSSATDAKIGASFGALAESLLARDKDLLEHMAREILRPMLKDWLDDNLPDLVERLVRAEIERIARGRG
jgi:hypothetical protein